MSNYGTAGNHSRGANHGTSEEESLLPRKSEKGSFIQHMNTDINPKYGDLILLLCYVITGLLDSCATAVWGSFVSMQTGNTVYVGLGLANPRGSTRWVKSGTSILAFGFGSFCFARFHRYFSPKKRWVLTMSFVAQLLLIIGAALITMMPSDGQALSWRVLVPIGMMAFQSSGQAVTSRALSYGGLTSVVLTSIYCDLFSDAKLFAWPTENVERNRRLAAPILLLIGALFGGFWAETSIGLAGALWTAAVLKAFIVLAWLVWKADPKNPARLP